MEFLGTYFLILAVSMTLNPLAIAAMLMAWIYIGGYVSGAHYNPAVSLGVAFSDRLAWPSFVRYAGAQVLGGIAAYATTLFMYGQFIIPAPAQGIGLLKAGLVEVLLSFVFVLVVLTTALSKRFKASSVFGFAIGFSVLALAILGAPTSGGLFNPAIAIGANIMGLIRGMPVSWEHVLMYVGGACLGGFLAATAFKYFTPEDER